MPALDDDALGALWSVYDGTGVRPEYVIPVLYTESGFNPGIQNAAGAPYYGVAQTSAARLAALGTTPAAFVAMSQGDQIRTAVLPYFSDVVKRYGAIRSATRAYQANFEPATLSTARGLSQVIEFKGSRAYADNVGLDVFHHGAITVADLALVMTRAAAAAPARAATARAYQLRPSAAPPRPAVFGDDFVSPPATLAAAMAAAFLLSRL